ncbi:MAG: LysR family transcriptional regulator [Betaproteobacteria bacterium]|nr:LysR family transcriptional regulator [Betaproteobacteria bacterium]
MFHKLPSLNGLVAFEAVARLQSFANAAQELCVTQSAISHRIRLLEEYFEVRLLVRSRGAVTLTAQGTHLLGGVLDAMSALQAMSTRLASSGRKLVRLSIGPALARSWLIGKLGAFYATHREIDLEINAVRLAPGDKVTCLKSGEADVAIRYGSEQNWPGFACVKLLQSEVFPVCGPGYRAAHPGLARLAALRDATLLRLSRQPWVPWFRAAGLTWKEPTQGPIFSDAGIMLDAAANGQGIALARSVLVNYEIATGRLVRLFDISIPSGGAHYAIYSPHSAAHSEVTSFIDWLVAAAGDTGDRMPSSQQAAWRERNSAQRRHRAAIAAP